MTHRAHVAAPTSHFAPPSPHAQRPSTHAADGSKGAAKTQKQVLDEKVWPLVSACLAKERTEF